MCVFAYNVSRSEATGYTPYFLMFGRDAVCPLDLMLKAPSDEVNCSVDDFVTTLQQRFGQAFDTVLQQQKTRTERMKQAYDANVTLRRFSVNQFVWYYYPRTPVGRTPKWQRFYTGPYRVEKVLNDVNYVIRRSSRTKAIVAHADKLKLYYGPLPACWARIEDRRQAERHLADRAEGPSSSIRRIVSDTGPVPRASGAARPAEMSLRSGTDDSDLDLGLPPDINLLSPFHRSLSDVSSGQDVDATVPALSVPQVSTPKYDEVRNVLLESEEVGAPLTGANIVPIASGSAAVQFAPADSTSDEEVEEVPAPMLPGNLTTDEIVTLVADHPDLSWGDINAVLVSRQVSGTVTPAQLDCLQMVIQTSIATEMSLYGRVVQTAQPFLAGDPTGTMGLLAGFQVLDRASRRPI
jgi:hypothetical protein